MTIQHRRDSFCDIMSVCNNLRLYAIPYSLTRLHTCPSIFQEFSQDLAQFALTCRRVMSFETCRHRAISVRPASFNTARYSQKLVENAAIMVEVIDLFEILGASTNSALTLPSLRKTSRDHRLCPCVPPTTGQSAENGQPGISKSKDECKSISSSDRLSSVGPLWKNSQV